MKVPKSFGVMLWLACTLPACSHPIRPPAPRPSAASARYDPRLQQARWDLSDLAAAYLRCKQECPTLDQLIAETPRVFAIDPWGSRYAVLCTDHDFYVQSWGPDGRSGTADDLRAEPFVPAMPVVPPDPNPWQPCPTFPPCPRH